MNEMSAAVQHRMNPSRRQIHLHPMLGLCALSLLLAAAPATSPSTAPATAPSTPPTSASADAQWTMPTKDYANTRYSTLDQINTDNAKNLKLAWTFSTGIFRGQEAAPLVIGDTMYVVTPFPNYLFALDLNKPGTIK